MKVIVYLYAFANAQSVGNPVSNRAYSDWPPFLVDGSAKKYWKHKNNHITKYNVLAPATELFYDTFFSANAKAEKFAKNARRWLHDVASDFPRNVKRCDKRAKREPSVLPVLRKRRDANQGTSGWQLPVDQGMKKGYEALFYQYARWAREEIYWDCPKIGMRIVSIKQSSQKII